MSHRPSVEHDNELRLVVAACRAPDDPQRAHAVEEALAAPIRWPRVAALAERHRIAGLVHDALARSHVDPAHLAGSGLAAQARSGALRTLSLTREALRLQQLFDAHGVPCLTIKGAPIGVLAYGDVAIKHCWDIDLLIPPDRVAQACSLLRGAGYAMHEPVGLDDAQLLNFVAFAKEAIFIGPTGLAVELHWRLVDSPALLAGADPFAGPRQVPVGNGQLRTLNDRLQLAYLACHGQSHGWSRLKWIADVNGYLRRQPESTVAAMLDEADRLGAGGYAASAVWLCHTLFGLAVDEALVRQWRGRWSMRFAHAVNRRCIAGPVGGSDLTYYSVANLALIAANLAAADSWRVRRGIAKTLWDRPVERARGAPGFALGYSLRRLARLIIMLPNRISRDRARHRQAASRFQQD
ncbi:nucleotidyltransferase domain-containing protein [Sphingomonas sp. CCH10-B3]|uniref:nucleotidyltransferase domain-containing protein n=1 Tax=Sphingomonas sp. CCH10-B3 TaxID=1768757 RepID=UPI0009EA0F7D|nr:nucleotidyltransferase family protein [Sphingomonas sp. CCH10-B3]